MQAGWKQLGNKWYYLRSSGAMATGWYQEGSTWYYLDAENGDMKFLTYDEFVEMNKGKSW